MGFRQLFDQASSSYSYLLWDELSREAVIIDPVRAQADRDSQLIEELALTLRYALETHLHADHVMGGGVLRDRWGCQVGIHENAAVACADLLLKQDDLIEYGQQQLRVLHTPGHTDADVCYLGDDRVFTGDTLLIRGSGRTDFQSGSAGAAYDSIHGQLFILQDTTLVYPGHDYNGFTVSTIAEEKRFNPRLGQGRHREEFIRIMEQMELERPSRMDQAIPANQQCGSNQSNQEEQVDGE